MQYTGTDYFIGKKLARYIQESLRAMPEAEALVMLRHAYENAAFVPNEDGRFNVSSPIADSDSLSLIFSEKSISMRARNSKGKHRVLLHVYESGMMAVMNNEEQSLVQVNAMPLLRQLKLSKVL